MTNHTAQYEMWIPELQMLRAMYLVYVNTSFVRGVKSEFLVPTTSAGWEVVPTPLWKM